MKGKCLGKVKPLPTTERKDAYITTTPEAIVKICTERCPYPLAQCGSEGCDFFKAEKQRLIEAKVVKARRKRKC
jgi:hypothetical protein